jgi:hypothetical protein
MMKFYLRGYGKNKPKEKIIDICLFNCYCISPNTRSFLITQSCNSDFFFCKYPHFIFDRNLDSKELVTKESGSFLERGDEKILFHFLTISATLALIF